MITSDIPTGKGGGEKANYFIIIVHLLSSFIIGYHHLNLGFDSRRLHSTRFLLYKKRVECPEPVEGQLHVPVLYKKRVECPEPVEGQLHVPVL